MTLHSEDPTLPRVPANRPPLPKYSPDTEKYTNAQLKEEVEHIFEDGLSQQLTEAVISLRNTRLPESTVFYDDRCIQDGLYMKVQIYRSEPALGPQVLKHDHFHGIHRLDEKFKDVPNFRRARHEFPIYGCGQPQYDKLSDVAKYLLTSPDATFQGTNFTNVEWICLRAEPVVFVNDLPMAPRHPKSLNVNLDYLNSIDAFDLHRLERRLKADVIHRSSKTNDTLEYWVQTSESNEIRDAKISASNVKTVLDLFKGLRLQGKPINYHRTPIADEVGPEEKEFDSLVQHIRRSPRSSCFVFQCQMGRGRTTTGMVSATLIMRAMQRTSVFGTQPKSPSLSLNRANFSEDNLALVQQNQEFPNYQGGEFKAIMKLVCLLDDGLAIKAQVDRAIDECDHMQNLRTTIYEAKAKSDDYAAALHATCEDPDDPEAVQLRSNQVKYHNYAVNYLERYWWLIVFNAYLNEHASSGFRKSFVQWMSNRWGLRRTLRNLNCD